VVAIHLAERLVETGAAWLAALVRALKLCEALGLHRNPGVCASGS